MRESRKIVAQVPSIELLLGLEGERNRTRYEFRRLTEALTGRANELEHSLARIDELAKTWGQTLAAAKDNSAPPELLVRIQTVTTELRRARDLVDKQRALGLTMQSRVAVQDSRITDALIRIEQARKNTLSRILLQDSPPIWSPAIRSSQNLQNESWSSFSRQWTTLRAYAERQSMRFAFAVVTFFVLAGLLVLMRQRVRKLPAEKTVPSRAGAVFEMPFTAALILALLASRWVFPNAPRLLWAIIELSPFYLASLFCGGSSGRISIRLYIC